MRYSVEYTTPCIATAFYFPEEQAVLDNSENGVQYEPEVVATSDSSSLSAPDAINDDYESVDSQPLLAGNEIFVNGGWLSLTFSSENVYRSSQKRFLLFADYCYFETATSGPFQIRRIEEFVKVLYVHFESAI